MSRKIDLIFRKSWVKEPYLKNFRQTTFYFKHDKSSRRKGRNLERAKVPSYPKGKLEL